MPTFIQDPKTGKLVPKDEYITQRNSGVYIQGDLENFVSPVTGEVISDRAQLREHNRRHNVTDSRDFSPEYIKGRRDRRIAEQEREGKRDRLESLKRQFYQ